MKQTFVAVGVSIALVAVCLGYWGSIGEAGRWLFFNKAVAEKHADALLRGERPEVPDDLIDVQISKYAGWVLLSPHSDSHELVLAYAPSGKPDPITASGVQQWRQISGHWYELIQNQAGPKVPGSN